MKLCGVETEQLFKHCAAQRNRSNLILSVCLHVYRYHWVFDTHNNSHEHKWIESGKLRIFFIYGVFRWLVWLIFMNQSMSFKAGCVLQRTVELRRTIQIGRWFSSSQTRFQKCVWFPYGMHIISCRLPPVRYSPALVVVVAIVNVNAITSD